MQERDGLIMQNEWAPVRELPSHSEYFPLYHGARVVRPPSAPYFYIR